MELITIPRRFWLFRSDTSKAKGGLLDMEPGSFGSVQEAVNDFAAGYDFAQVGAVNPHTGELETVAWYDGGTWFREAR